MSFTGLCTEGRLEEAKALWITQKDGPSPIDIHALSDYAFRWASCGGHLKTAKWLISLGGMPVGPTHPLRSFYLDRFAIIGLLKVFIGRYVRNLRERLYAPGGVGYLRAKERNPLFI